MKTLKELREENAFSIRDLAAKAGVSPNTIARSEHGKVIRPISKRAICKALKLSPKDIDWNLTYKLT